MGAVHFATLFNEMETFGFLSVEITVRGAVDPKTGMVMNITELKDYIDRVIMKTLDHKNLDKDVDYFTNGGRVSCNRFK